MRPTPSRAVTRERSHQASPISSSARRQRGQRGGLEDAISSYFNPEARQDRETNQGMARFYSLRLQEANSSIIRLQEENSCLRDTQQAQLLHLQEEHQRAQQRLIDENLRLNKEATQHAVELQGMRNKLDLLQLRMEMSVSHAHHQFA